MYEEIRKDSLKALLTSRRRALEPEAVGLPPKHHKRLPGLSQEDAAHLTGVSVRWWSDFENGQHTPHVDLIDAVAAVLRMNEHERADLYFLTLGHAPATPEAAPLQADTDEVDLVLRAQPMPAVLTDHVGNVLARNPAAVDYFPHLAEGGGPSNMTLCLFGPAAETRMLNLDELRALRIGQLKAMCLRYRDDPTTIEVMQRVLELPEAVRLWATERASLNHCSFKTQVRRGPGLVGELTWTIAEFTNGKQFMVGYPPPTLS